MLLAVIFANLSSCIINDNIKDSTAPIDPGNDPNFQIVANTDDQFKDLNRKLLFSTFQFLHLKRLKIQN